MKKTILAKKMFSAVIAGSMVFSAMTAPIHAENEETAKNVVLGTYEFSSSDEIKSSDAAKAYVDGGKLVLPEVGWKQVKVTLTDRDDKIKEFWNAQTDAAKIIRYEFDIKLSDAEGKRKFGIFLDNGDAEPVYKMQIFGVSESGEVGFNNMWGSSKQLPIPELAVDTEYHYSYELDIKNKTAKATISDGTNTYESGTKTVDAGNEHWDGWWSNDLGTPMNLLCFMNISADTAVIDNLKVTQVREELKAEALSDKDGNVIVKFNYPVNAETAVPSNITLKNEDGDDVNYSGSLSADGKTYTMTVSGGIGEYTVNVTKAVKPADTVYVAPLAKAYEAVVNTKDYVIGYNDFTGETVTQRGEKKIATVTQGVLELINGGSEWTSTNIKFAETSDAVSEYLSGETTAPKKMKLEFDIKITDNDGSGTFKINLANRNESTGWVDGVCVFSASGANSGWLNKGTALTSGGLKTGVTYHYVLNLDADNKKASVTLTSGDTQYQIAETSIAGEDGWGDPYWKPKTKTPLDVISVFNAGYDYIEIDNLKYTAVRDGLSASTITAGDEIQVKFNYPVDAETAVPANITLTDGDGRGVDCSGSLSADGKTYTMTMPEDAESGAYTVSVNAAVKPVDTAYVSPMAENYSAKVNVNVDGMEGIVLGKYTFDGTEKITIGGANKAKVENGKLVVSALSGDYNQILTYVKPDDAADAIADFWKEETSATKKLKVEFDFNAKDEDEAGQCNILFNNYKQKTTATTKDWTEGLNILTVSGTKSGYGNLDGADGKITADGFKYNTDYHYSMELDLQTKVATFVITDGTHTYKAENVSVAGEDSWGTPWWKPKSVVPFDNLTFMNLGVDTFEMDNLTYTRIVDKPTVSTDNVKVLENAKEQSEWKKISPMSNKITVDLKTQLNESSLTENVYLVNKSTGKKIASTGALSDTVYTLTLTEKLAPSTEYTLYIKSGVKNIASAKLGSDYSYDFKTTAGEVKAVIGEITKDGEPVTALSGLTKNEAVKLNISYENSTGEDQTFYAIIAYYNGSALVKADLVKIDKASTVTSEEISIDYTVPDYGTATTAKIMCWDNFKNLKPLGESKDF